MRTCGLCSCLIRFCSARPIRHVVGFQANIKGLYITPAEQVWTGLSARCDICVQLMLVFFRTSARSATKAWCVTCAQVVGANARRLVQKLKHGTRGVLTLLRCGRMIKPGLDFTFHGVPDNALNSIQDVYVSFPLYTKYTK